MFERASHLNGEPQLLATRYAVPEEQPVVAWLQAVDAARRASASQVARNSTVSQPVAESAWLGLLSANAEPDPVTDTAVAFGLRQAPEPELVVFFDSTLIDSGLGDVLLSGLIQTVEELVAKPEAKVADIDTLGPAQIHRLLGEWNAPPRAHDPTLTVHGLFSREAAVRGDATALIWRGGRLSYRELNQRSDAMAERIREGGAPPGSTVCIALGRSPESIVALLAILKAGAAYLPVDTGYPAERLAFMLEDAAVSLVVTTSAHQNLFAASLPKLLVDNLGVAGPETTVPPATPCDGRRPRLHHVHVGFDGRPQGH